MITTQNQEALATWLCTRIELTDAPDLQCIGNVHGDEILGVVGYEGYNGASIQIHVAGEGNWFTKDLRWAAFDYPFKVLKVKVLIGLVGSNNARAIKFNKHLGFKVEHIIADAHPDGDLLIMTMTPAECRYLDRSTRHGQKIKGTATA